MKVPELKAILDEAGIEYPKDAKKADLEELYDSHVELVKDEQPTGETEDTEGLKEVPVVEEDEFAGLEAEEEGVPQGYYKNELIVRSDNRIMNGRMYKEVETVTATYLITPAEFEVDVIYK